MLKLDNENWKTADFLLVGFKIISNFQFSCTGFSKNESHCAMYFVSGSDLDSNNTNQEEIYLNTNMEKLGNCCYLHNAAIF